MLPLGNLVEPSLTGWDNDQSQVSVSDCPAASVTPVE
jgi:hypothetical protein